MSFRRGVDAVASTEDLSVHFRPWKSSEEAEMADCVLTAAAQLFVGHSHLTDTCWREWMRLSRRQQDRYMRAGLPMAAARYRGGVMSPQLRRECTEALKASR